MTRVQSILRHAGALAAAGLLAACAAKGPASVAAAVPPTTSMAQAEQRLAEVARERAAIAARYAEREVVCYEKFFVNDCLDEAKDRRRIALAGQRAIEVEAEYFQRKYKVEERDKAIAAAEAEYRAREAGNAAQPDAPKTISPVPPPRASSVPGRIARRDARAAQEAAAEPANAATRAANAAAFEGRRLESEKRQREVAQRKAEREAKRAAAQAQKEKDKAAAAAQKAAVPAK